MKKKNPTPFNSMTATIGNISEVIFNIKCFGRSRPGVECLEEPVDAKVKVRQVYENIHMDVECPHNTGGHGQRCCASHPGKDKVGDGVYCPYSIDVPYCNDVEEP